jgi:hypothetical protein
LIARNSTLLSTVAFSGSSSTAPKQSRPDCASVGPYCVASEARAPTSSIVHVGPVTTNPPATASSPAGARSGACREPPPSETDQYVVARPAGFAPATITASSSVPAAMFAALASRDASWLPVSSPILSASCASSRTESAR